MAHAQKPDFVLPRNGLVHLNRWGRQFSRMLAAEVCASAWVMQDIPHSEVAWEHWLPTPLDSFPFTSPPVGHRVPPGSERALLNLQSDVGFRRYRVWGPDRKARRLQRQLQIHEFHIDHYFCLYLYIKVKYSRWTDMSEVSIALRARTQTRGFVHVREKHWPSNTNMAREMIAITATDVQTKFNIPIKWLLMVTLYVHCLSYFNNQLNA